MRQELRRTRERLIRRYYPLPKNLEEVTGNNLLITEAGKEGKDIIWLKGREEKKWLLADSFDSEEWTDKDEERLDCQLGAVEVLNLMPKEHLAEIEKGVLKGGEVVLFDLRYPERSKFLISLADSEELERRGLGGELIFVIGRAPSWEEMGEKIDVGKIWPYPISFPFREILVRDLEER